MKLYKSMQILEEDKNMAEEEQTKHDNGTDLEEALEGEENAEVEETE